MFSQTPHEAPYTITSIDVPSSTLQGATRIFVSGEGQTVVMPASRLPLGPVTMELGTELVGNEKERKKQLDALKAVVGKKAGAYLYENKVTDKDGNTKYFVGIYTNGPDGKGPAFEKINEAAGEVAAIINDAPIQRIGIVPNNTLLTSDYGTSIVIGSIDQGLSPGVTSEFGGVTTSYILDPSVKPGKLPEIFWSNGKAQQPTPGELLGHELGHGRARVTRDPNSNAASLRLENKVRTKVNNKTSTRISH